MDSPDYKQYFHCIGCNALRGLLHVLRYVENLSCVQMSLLIKRCQKADIAHFPASNAIEITILQWPAEVRDGKALHL